MGMAIAEDMKKLGEDIVASYDMRVKAIGELVKDTHTTLKGFHTEHKEMSAALRAELAKGEQSRLKDFESMMGDIQNFVKGLAKNVGNMLKTFQKEHKEMADELKAGLEQGETDRLKDFKTLKAGLEQGETDRLKDFKTMMSEIEKFIGDVSKNVSNMIKGFQKEHRAMADELESGLEQGETQRLNDFQKMMADIRKDIKEIETFVANKLKEFDAEHADMSEELKNLLKEISSDMAQARKVWQGMSATMAKARKAGFMMPEVDAGQKVRTVKQAMHKAQGKKKTSPKSEDSGKKVGVGV